MSPAHCPLYLIKNTLRRRRTLSSPVLSLPPPPYLPVLCADDELQPLKQAVGNEGVVQLEEALPPQGVTRTQAQQEQALNLGEYLVRQLLGGE